MQATGYVYLFRCGDLFKIGFSEDPQRRLAQVGGDEILHVILCADARSAERSLHQRFSSLRDHGEYFRLGEEEIAEILGIQSDASLKPLGINTIHAWVDDELADALQAYVDSTEPRVSKTSTIEAALRAFLREKGFWPPS